MTSRIRTTVLLLAAALLLITATLYAQSDVNNPTGIEFTASTDHAGIDSYEVDILRPDESVLQTLNIGKPVPDASNTITATINVQPIAFATGYSVRVRARAGTAVSDYAVSINKFNRVPGGPGRPTIR
jgi:hypothetical protein